MKLRLPRGFGLGLVVAAGVAASATGAELPLHQIVESLFNAKPGGAQLDFSGKDLSLLDLSGVDFKRANLAGANLLGDDLTGANLSSVNHPKTSAVTGEVRAQSTNAPATIRVEGCVDLGTLPVAPRAA